MKAYLDLLREIRDRGTRKADRTGTGTLSLFGEQMRFDLSAGLSAGDHQEDPPALGGLRAALVPARRHQHRAICASTASRSGTNGPMAQGELGPVYGKQWRRWGAADGRVDRSDQRACCGSCAPTRTRAASRQRLECRRARAHGAAPCHALFQFYVADGRLSCQLYQRSADVFLGVPFNIASYALLTHMMAQQCDLQPGEFIWTRRRLPPVPEPPRAGRAAAQRARRLPPPQLALRRRPPSIFDYHTRISSS